MLTPLSVLTYQSHDRGLHPKGTINCAGYKVLTSMEQYLDLISNSLPGEEEEEGWWEREAENVAATFFADNYIQHFFHFPFFFLARGS